MSMILRTGKFIRCFASATRTVLNTQGYDSNLLQSTRSLTFGYSQTWSHGMATQAQQAETLGPLLQRLDAEVRRCGRLSRRDLDEMLEEVRQRHAVTSSQSLLIIRCCGSLVPEELPEERTRLVEQIWKTLMSRGVPMDISHYNALLRVYIENEHDFSPSDFLKELEEKGLEPNRVTYQRLMWRHCQRGDVEGASRVLERMRAQELPLSEAVLDALVLGHSRLGDMEGARSVLGVMASAGLSPGPRTYALLMGGSAARGDMDQVRATIQECKDKEIYLSDKDFLDVVEECALGGHEEHMDYLLEQMQRSAGYNQEAINLILRLTARRKEGAAFKVLRTLTHAANPVQDSTPTYQGAFFIRQLVKTDCPPDTIISVCKQLQEENFSPKALFIATDAALQFKKRDTAVALLRALQAAGHPVRQHYFWPLITSGKMKNDQKVLDVVKMMMDDFKVGVSSETLRDYVIRNLKTSDPYLVMELLRGVGVTVSLAGKTMVHSLLLKNKLNDAADLASKYGTKINLNICAKPLIDSLIETQNIESFVKLVHLSNLDTSPRRNQSNATEDGEQGEDNSPPETENILEEHRFRTGKLISRLIGMSPSQVIPFLPELLDSLHSKGLGISTIWAQKIQEKLGESLTSEISQGLAKLTSEDLLPLPLDTPNIPNVRRSAERLEVMVAESTAQGDSNPSLKKQLLLAYVRNRQEDKVSEYLQTLEAENFVLSSGVLAQLMEFYAMIDNVEKANKYLQQIIDTEPEFQLDDIKVLRLVELYAKHQQFEKAAEILQRQKPERAQVGNTFLYNSICWHLLNCLADQGNVTKINEIFNLLQEKQMIEVTNLMLGPLVKVHIVVGDVEGALNEFERCCREYRCTPWKGELTKKLIASEDAAGLQRLTDLSTAIHGEVNSLYDLVFGFVECGRLRQARRILETPGMRTRNQRFNSACERYGQEGKVDYLEGLLEATRELSHIDRSEVFQQLLLTYTREGKVDKALGLWTLLQEESVAPTDKFLIHLADFLKANDIQVPFIIPATPEVTPPETKKDEGRVERKQQSKMLTPQDKFQKAVTSGDLNSALLIKNNEPMDYLKYGNVSILLEKLTNGGRLKEAVDLTIDAAKKGRLPDTSKVRFLLNTLASKGDLDAFEKLDQQFTEDQKRFLSFDNRRCNAYISSGNEKINEYLDSMMVKISAAESESDLKQLQFSFPKGGMLGLISNPASIPKFVEIAEKYAEKKITTPFNILWMHYLLEGQDDKAQAIWDQHLSSTEMVMFKRILQESRQGLKTDILDKLLHYLKSSTIISPRALGHAYSCKMDIFIAKGEHQSAMSTLTASLSDGLSLDDFSRGTLVRIKNAIELAGGQFNHKIPDITNQKNTDIIE